ncbi:MAG: hypothetical protein NTV00_17035, partial [Methylococcales bacterium]|nr:hypothetical protein [Methylococcales bacterium]
MLTFRIKPLFIAFGLSCLSVNSWAQLSSNKAVVNSINGDNITATVSFPTPVTGDLYVAADIGGGALLFIGKGATFSTTPTAFQSNGSFTTDLTVLDIPTAGIPAGVYPLYQVVAKAGSNPLDFNNWIGGFGGLSNITFTINLANTAHTPDPLPVVTAIPDPIPTSIP